MDKLIALTNVLAEEMKKINLNGGAQAGVSEEEVRQLQEMFQGSDLSRSVLTTVLDQHEGRLDAAIDTLLNLANDPLAESPPKRRAAAPTTTKEVAAVDVHAQTEETTQHAQTAEDEEQKESERALQRSRYLDKILSDLALEDARLMEELRLLEAEKRESISPRGTATPVTTPVTPTATPVTMPATPVASRSPSSSLDATSGVGAGTATGVAKDGEVISILQTHAMFPPELETSSSDELSTKSSSTSPALSRSAVTEESVLSVRKLVCPTSARQGDIVGVSWDLGPEGEPSSGDWIGLFKQNQPSSTQYVIYKKTGGAKRGIIDVAAPGLGTWEFRFFPNNSYDYVMKSNLLIVGPQVELTASLDESGNEIRVSCRLLSGQVSHRDWIGLYKVDTYHNKEYLDLRYVANINDTLTFPAPRTPGHYELRYFPAASAYNDVARSNLITVEDRDMVIATPSRVVQGSDEQLIATWQIYSVPTSKWDWVGLYPVGSSAYVEYHYVDPNEPTCTFAVPQQAGQYELRYFASATSTFLTSTMQRRSTKVTVLPATRSTA